MKKIKSQTIWRIIIFAVVLFGLLSLIFPVDRTNPPVTGEIKAPEKVMAILRRACFDCHSNETAWPWYSYVTPTSWLIAKDVREGREELNFSEWSDYNIKQQNHKRKKCGKEVEKGEMPLWFYIPLHPEADLSQEDIETLKLWSDGTLRN
jgi:hypothetical protein